MRISFGQVALCACREFKSRTAERKTGQGSANREQTSALVIIARIAT